MGDSTAGESSALFHTGRASCATTQHPQGLGSLPISLPRLWETPYYLVRSSLLYGVDIVQIAQKGGHPHWLIFVSMTLGWTCPTSDSTSSGNIRVGYVISQLDRYPPIYPLMNTPIYSCTTTEHSYTEEFNNKASKEISYLLTPPVDSDIYINTINTTLYVPETRPLYSRTNTQLRDSHLSPLDATTSQAAVSSADSMSLLGYPGPLFKTRPAHNIQSPRQ